MFTSIIPSLKKSEWFILAGLLFLSLVPCVGGLFRLIELGGGSDFSPTLPANPRISNSPLPVVFHLLSSIPYCVLGAFQFLPSFRQRHPKWHRIAGRLLVVAGIISAASGLWMTHFYSFSEDLQGALLYSVRLVVGGCMIAFIILGLAAVLKRNFSRHQSWMIRGYALGQGAGTQVFLAIPWLLFYGEPTGFTRDILMTAGWVINILIAELSIFLIQANHYK